MGRPSNESKKRIAALEQLEAMKKQGLLVEVRRSRLMESGLTVAQVNDIDPLPLAAPVQAPAPMVNVNKDNSRKLERVQQLVSELGHFLEQAYRELQDAKPKHQGIRSNMGIWARKCKALGASQESAA